MATRNTSRLLLADRVSSLDSARRERRSSDQGRAPVSIVIGDLYAAARAGARAAIEPFGFTVVGEAVDAGEAVALARRERPQLCLLAVDLPGDGLGATRRVAAELPETTVVVLGDEATDAKLTAAIEAGASGYVPRTAAPAYLPTALNSALDGHILLPLALFTRVLQRGARRTGGPHALPGLPAVHFTRREQQVLTHLLEGESTAAIAVRLGVSAVTVRRYTSDIMRKAGVADRDELRALWKREPAE